MTGGPPLAQLVAQSCLAGAVAAWSPLLPGVATRIAWRRFGSLTSTMLTPQLLLKALPALGPHINLEVDPGPHRNPCPASNYRVMWQQLPSPLEGYAPQSPAVCHVCRPRRTGNSQELCGRTPSCESNRFLSLGF